MARRSKFTQTDETELPAYDKPGPGQFTLENIVTQRWGFGLDDPTIGRAATPVQRAACRILDGIPLGDLALDPDVIAALGGTVPELEGPPRLAALMWAARGAKSMIVSGKAIVTAHTCAIPDFVTAGDSIRIPIVSTETDTAKATFQHLIGPLQDVPYLRSLMLDEPTSDSVWLRHESGRPIEIKVIAMSRAGSTLVGRWMPCAIFDEAPRMGGDEYVKSLDDALKAIRVRIFPGGTIMLSGAPNVPSGPVFELYEQHFGKSSRAIVFIKATGPMVNPAWFTEEKCEELRVDDPDAYRTDVLADFLTPEEGLFDHHDVKQSTREELVRKPEPGVEYTAGTDPGTRGNAWTLIIVGSKPSARLLKYHTALAVEWRGTGDVPLRPRNVLKEIATLCKPYGLTLVVSDMHMSDALVDMAEEKGLTLHPEQMSSQDALQQIESVRALLESDLFEFAPVKNLRADLLTCRRRVNQTGGKSLVLPDQPGGRHCDFIPALARAMKYQPPPALPEEKTNGDEKETDLQRELRECRERNSNGHLDQCARAF